MFQSSFLKLVSNQLKASFSTHHKEAKVLFKYSKNVCKLTLNKPKALNALDLEMYRMIQAEVDKWNQNPNLRVVLFTGAGGKSFCSGGDIRSLYDAKYDASKAYILDAFFREEYSLDYNVATMKPIQVVFWDGIVMGGGAGISANAPIRIATENAVFAMPGNLFKFFEANKSEAKIGLFTDVGGGYFLPRLRKHLGFFLGLTGERLRGVELVQAGIAHSYVKREKLESLEREIIESTNLNTNLQDLQAIVKKYEEPVEVKYPNEDFIDGMFSKGTLEEIYLALKETKENKEFANKLVEIMDAQSPLSMQVIFEQLQRGKNLDLKENLRIDLRIITRFMEGREFFEGVRCTLVEKNGKPQWSHKSLFEVPKNEVLKYFEKLPNNKDLQ